MTRTVFVDEADRKLIVETRLKLDEAARLMEELLETIEILSDPDMMENIRKGTQDVRAGRVRPLRDVLKEEAP